LQLTPVHLHQIPHDRQAQSERGQALFN
jgi:hypothetical protein